MLTVNIGLLIELILPAALGFAALFMAIIAMDAKNKIEPNLRTLTTACSWIAAVIFAILTMLALYLNIADDLFISSILMMIIVCFAPAELAYKRISTRIDDAKAVFETKLKQQANSAQNAVSRKVADATTQPHIWRPAPTTVTMNAVPNIKKG